MSAQGLVIGVRVASNITRQNISSESDKVVEVFVISHSETLFPFN